MDLDVSSIETIDWPYFRRLKIAPNRDMSKKSEMPPKILTFYNLATDKWNDAKVGTYTVLTTLYEIGQTVALHPNIWGEIKG